MADYIQQMISGAAGMLAKAFTGNDVPAKEIFIEEAEDADKFAALLLALIAEGEYNRAENILFEQLEKTPDIDIYSAGLTFYDRMDAEKEERLLKGGFSRAEISQGRNDMKKYISRYLKKPAPPPEKTGDNL